MAWYWVVFLCAVSSFVTMLGLSLTSISKSADRDAGCPLCFRGVSISYQVITASDSSGSIQCGTSKFCPICGRQIL